MCSSADSSELDGGTELPGEGFEDEVPSLFATLRGKTVCCEDSKVWLVRPLTSVQ